MFIASRPDSIFPNAIRPAEWRKSGTVWLSAFLYSQGSADENGGDNGAREYRDRAGEEHCSQSAPTGDEPERGAAKSQGDVEEDRVSAHRKPATLWRRAADGFSAEPGI